MKTFFSKLWAAVELDRTDVVFVCGLGLLTYGAFAVYYPAGYLVPGAILTGLGLWAARGK
jgi:hypothetical protein